MEFEGKYNKKSPAVKRLMREACELREATDEYCAKPLEDNLFEWHFTVRGPPNTEFEGGLYHGRILLPTEYPIKPPNIILLTPNGRFEINKKICLSISEHHPETWQPSWSIRTALLALIAFMPTPGNGTIGSLDYTAEERKQLANKSQSWECSVCGKMSSQLTKTGVSANAITEAESAHIKNVIFKGEDAGESNVSNKKEPTVEKDQLLTEETGRVENIENEQQTENREEVSNTVSPQSNASNIPSQSYTESFFNFLIGVIVAAIAILIYRRLFLL